MAVRNDRYVVETVELSHEELLELQGGFELAASPEPEAILIGQLLPAIQKVR